MIIKNYVYIFAFSIALILITTCTTDSTSPNNEDNNGELDYSITAEQTIDNTGGTLTEPNSGTSITVPQGALDNATKLEVGPAVNVPIDNTVHLDESSYHFGPDGQQFNVPVLMKMPYDPNKLPNNITESNLQIHYYDRYNDTWTTVGDSVNTQTNEVYAKVDHFCFFTPGGNIAPNPVTLNEPTNPTGNSITLNWTQNVDADFQSYKIYYSTTSGVTNQSILAATITKQNQTTYTVTGLQPQTTYYFVVYVYDTGSLNTNSNEKSKATTEQVNTAPTASFTVDPTSGTTATVFNFDASGCTDNEDPTSSLQVRWDWENDGVWDTNYTTTKTATYQYTMSGIYEINLEVADPSNLTHATTKQCTVSIQYTGTITDIDGNVYNTIQIGNQLWIAENLKVKNKQKGETIPELPDYVDWANTNDGAFCNFRNDENFANTYGRLYNWYAVNDSRNLAPKGWHIPSDEEWNELELFLGMAQEEVDFTVIKDVRGDGIGTKLKSTTGWRWDNNGTNESGFTALPAGYRTDQGPTGWINGWFFGFGTSAYFYTSSEIISRFLSYDHEGIDYGGANPNVGMSVRCVKD